ncbi:MAG: hypothetical protein J5379_02580 [Clostridiales bacterium]|nr:hypothetical protein [Clostridiales bacterium]
MKKETKLRRFLSVIMCVAMLGSIMTSSVLAEDDDEDPEIIEEFQNVEYIGRDGETHVTPDGVIVRRLAEPETEEESATISSGWYYVLESDSHNYYQRINIEGDVKLILEGAASIWADQGIHVNNQSSLTVYATDISKYASIYCNSNVPAYCAGIGGDADEQNGYIEINNCKVDAKGGKGAAGIGTGGAWKSLEIPAFTDDSIKIVINAYSTYFNSVVLCDGGPGGAGIGGGANASNCPIFIESGHVSAYGYDGGAGIGAGYGKACGYIEISGGHVIGYASYKNEEYYGAGIGDGYGGSYAGGCVINIKGGEVDAYSDYGGALLFSRSEIEADIPADAVRVFAGSKAFVEDPNDLSDKIAQDVSQCLISHHAYITKCDHENGYYQIDEDSHTMVCPDCMVPLPTEPHVNDANGICTVCARGAEATIRSATVLFDGKLQMRFSMSFSQSILADDDAYVSIVNEDMEETKVLVKDGAVNGDVVQFFYPFIITDFQDEVTLRVFRGGENPAPVSLRSAKGTDYTDTGFVYSPEIYAQHIKQTSSGGPMYQFAYDFYLYAVNVKEYFYPGDWSNDIYDYPDRNWDLDDYKISADGNRPDGYKKSTIRMYFEEDHTLRVTFYLQDGYNVSDYEFYRDGVKVSPRIISDTCAAVDVREIAAPNLGAYHTFGIKVKGSTQDPYTINACALCYARLLTNDYADAGLRANVGWSIYNYYLSACEYFNWPVQPPPGSEG